MCVRVCVCDPPPPPPSLTHKVVDGVSIVALLGVGDPWSQSDRLLKAPVDFEHTFKQHLAVDLSGHELVRWAVFVQVVLLDPGECFLSVCVCVCVCACEGGEGVQTVTV